MTRSKKRDSFTEELEPGANALGVVQSYDQSINQSSEIYT